METISSMAHTAAKAVWGDGTEHEEPVSGVQGDVSKGEPYDAGNLEPKKQPDQESGSRNDGTTAAKLNRDDDTNVGSKAENVTSTTATDKLAGDADPESTSKLNEEDAAGAGDSKQGVMGDGPKSLADIAKQHGGDAGNSGDLPQVSESKSSTGADGGADDASDPKRDGDGENEGTGEKWVKTSGLAADGGDFDATKPGAGREADRLMEEKGLHHETGTKSGGSGDSSCAAKPDTSSTGSGDKEGKDKPSLKERLKDKLHIHKS